MKTDPDDVNWTFSVKGKDAVDQLVHELRHHGDVRTEADEAKLADKRDFLHHPAT